MNNIEYSSGSMIKIDEQKITTARTGQRKKARLWCFIWGW